MGPLIVAHRGDSKYYPENTRSAFISAMKKEADLLETDVRKTKDGKLICIHDAYVDRVTNWKHSGYVRNLESELLERMKVFNPMTGREDRILFFDDFLELTRGERIIVEIKESGIEKEVVDPEDVEMLQDLILAAVNDALIKSQEMVSGEMGKLTGGLNIPGLT